MKIFHIFYHDDMDGECARAIMTKYYDDNFSNYHIIFHEMNHTNKDKAEIEMIGRGFNTESEIVVFVDYAFSENTLDLFQYVYEKTDSGKNLIWIDHHDSSIRFVDNHILGKPYEDGTIPEVIFDLPMESYLISKSGSGAYLAWAYVHRDDLIETCNRCKVIDDTMIQTLEAIDMYNRADIVPPAVRYVSDYDTFTHRLNPTTDFFKLGYDMEKSKSEFMNCLFRSLDSWDSDFTDDEEAQSHISICTQTAESGRIIMEYVTAENKRALEKCGYESVIPPIFSDDVEGTPIYVCNRMSNSWVFGEKYDQFKYVVVWYFTGNEYHYSIFSNLKKFPDANCEKIALKFGGGGHEGAAGWRSKHLMFEDHICILGKVGDTPREDLPEPIKEVVDKICDCGGCDVHCEKKSPVADGCEAQYLGN